MSSNIVLAGKENPIYSSIDPVNESNLEIGVKSIYYGNVSNSFFEFLVDGKKYVLPVFEKDYYSKKSPFSRHEILSLLLDQLQDLERDFGLPRLLYTNRKVASRGDDPDIILLRPGEGVRVLSFPKILKMQLWKGQNNQDLPYACVNSDIPWKTLLEVNQFEPAFIYCNLVETSILNGQRSKLLQVIPFQYGKGFTFHEILNPSYNPIKVDQFSYLEISIRNLKGELIRLSLYDDIVVSLEIREV